MCTNILINEGYDLDNNNEMVGGGLFQFTKDEALYAVAAYDRNQFDKPMGHVIQFRAIEELKKRTASWYKLGGRPFLNGQTTPTEKEMRNKLAEWVYGDRESLRKKYKNDQKIKNINIPVLVMHGEADQIVPFWMGKKIYEIANQPKYSHFTKYDDHMMEYDEKLLFMLKKFIKSLN